MSKHYTRRRRRQVNMKLRSGGKFTVRHKLISGRTGAVFSKRLKSRSQ